MGRAFVLVAIALLALGCSPGKLQGDELEARLEAGALGSEPLYAVRCRPGIEGWHYVCTFRRGSRLWRQKAAFLVGRDRIKASTAIMGLDLPVGPAPGNPDAAAWADFEESANYICGMRRQKIRALGPAGPNGRFVKRLAQAQQIQRVELAQLEALAPPPGEARKRLFADLLEGESRLVSASARFATAALRGKAGAAREAAVEVTVTSRRLDRLARELGLTRCVQTS